MAKTKTARILVDQDVDGIQYKIDDLIEFEANLVTTLTEQGMIDCHPDAVAYARSLGKEPRDHVSPKPKKSAESKNQDPEPEPEPATQPE